MKIVIILFDNIILKIEAELIALSKYPHNQRSLNSCIFSWSE